MLSSSSTGWLGYSNDQVKNLCSQYLANGFTAFKVKVGKNLEDDRHRCAMVRDIIGWDNKLVCIITLYLISLYNSLHEYECSQ
jgi:L-fuconate dehydratase